MKNDLISGAYIPIEAIYMRPANLRSPVAVDSSGRFPAGLCFSILGKFSSPRHSLSNAVLSFSILSTKEGPDSPARPEKFFTVILFYR